MEPVSGVAKFWMKQLLISAFLRVSSWNHFSALNLFMHYHKLQIFITTSLFTIPCRGLPITLFFQLTEEVNHEIIAIQLPGTEEVHGSWV